MRDQAPPGPVLPAVPAPETPPSTRGPSSPGRDSPRDEVPVRARAEIAAGDPSPIDADTAPTVRDGAAPGASLPISADPAAAGPDGTPYPAPTQAPAAPVPLWRRIPLGWVLFGIIVIGGAISSWYFGAGRSDTGEIAKPGDLTATDLRVGDCFDLKVPEASEIDDVAAVPCTQAHEFEMFHTASMPEGEYPAEAAFEDFVNAKCVPAFATYVGKAYEDSELDVYWLFPTSDGWRQGDRSIQCAVFHPRVHQLTESLKGSKR
jgi:hypothetical protein